jgi:hypothetical protein
MKTSAFTIVLFLAITGIGSAQDLGTQLSNVSGANLEKFLEPLTSGLGAGLNSGFYHSADLHNVLGFDIGVKLALVPMKGENKTYDFVLPPQITYNSQILSAGTHYPSVIKGEPTVVGSGTVVALKTTAAAGAIPAGTIIPIPIPGGFDISAVPMLVPQASIGLPMGLEVMARYMPATKLGDAGKANLFGFGIRHDLDQYIPLFPIDVAINFAMQTLNFTDMKDKKLLSAKTTAFGLEVSKSLVMFTLYGGFQIENSKFTIEPYDFTDPSTLSTAHFKGTDINGANKTRFLGGIRFLLAIINIHADYSFSKYPVATAGVGITFR